MARRWIHSWTLRSVMLSSLARRVVCVWFMWPLVVRALVKIFTSSDRCASAPRSLIPSSTPSRRNTVLSSV
uniref:Putative secreted protein n=1 Tax=Ixodes ricinus TaxID=34613 RepID=A0A6B0U9G8_IXORI